MHMTVKKASSILKEFIALPLNIKTSVRVIQNLDYIYWAVKVPIKSLIY